MQYFFSIIVVCLNAGEKLKDTLDSIRKQTFRDFEVVVKDGMSSDGSLDYAYTMAEDVNGRKGADKESGDREEDAGGCRVRVVQKKDRGIYDAMNQAAEAAEGRYLYFLNCGDCFFSADVLGDMWEFITESKKSRGIFYGNIYERRTGQVVTSNPHMDVFGCYRNVPCHQACFYSREIVLAHPFDVKYKVRADYEQFLWCFLGYEKRDRLAFAYKEIVIADYEGGGFSEMRENRKVSAREHREITKKYMTKGQLFQFRLIMLVTLAPLRAKIAENERTAGIYNRLKENIYTVKR
ncbi:glycosyltransferase [Parablautia muri]|uniref:Glycosyltransferase n=1 Tax=Parablautia muri TaxID=2320879 RepID=A0A9X5BH08_9FIRM|nr:glycosyltransferase [Parablautia muri]NBJ92767.1 glycosyltransferase [Parablautia muri]